VNSNTANLNNTQRDAYRGRDTSRAQAQQTLQARTGQNLSGNASQRVQNIHQGGTTANEARNGAQNVNRNNALRGAGDGNAARQEAQRGQASRESLASRGGGPGAGGGGQQRGGGFAGGGGTQQRGGGFGAGGGVQQRGGGLGAGGGGQRHFNRQR
jgi:hypothetical protein